MNYIFNIAVTALAIYAAITGNENAANATAVAAWLLGIMSVLASVIVFGIVLAISMHDKKPLGERIKVIDDMKKKSEISSMRKWFNRIMPTALLVSCAVTGYVATAIFFGLMWLVIALPVSAMARYAMDKFLKEHAQA